MTKSFVLGESLSVFIPVYNEENNLTRVVKQTLRDCKNFTRNFEVIVVNDGSSDKTADIAESLAKTYKNVKVIHHKKNQGLGRALWTGIKSCEKDIILFIDGDGQALLRDQDKLLKKIKEADVVLGFRGKRIDYSVFRKIASFGYLFLARVFFNLTYKDVNWVQTYRRKIFDTVELKSTSPFASTEVIVKALRNGFTVTEAPSVYHPRVKGRTKLGNITTAYKMFQEMVMLKFGLLD